MNKDLYFVKKTLSLANKARGFTSPNPLVGAIIVKDGRMISYGYHQAAGLAHAEIAAINKTKEDLTQATLYVNLEPCCHFGRTPPCVDEIIRRKFKRVVIATKDPNPLVNGRSINKLKKAGIKVSLGLAKEEAEKLNEVFFLNMRKKRPLVVVKVAQSLDGKIATSCGQSKWITNQEARIYAKSLRDQYDAVLVGVNTVIKDDPKLNGLNKIPYKVIIDPKLRIPKNAFILKEDFNRVIIITSLKNKSQKNFLPKGVKLIFIKEQEGIIKPKDILEQLYKLGICSVFIEGGSNTIGNFVDAKSVDKVYFFIAPKIIGGKSSLASVGARGVLSLDKALKIKHMKLENIGEDILISGYIV